MSRYAIIIKLIVGYTLEYYIGKEKKPKWFISTSKEMNTQTLRKTIDNRTQKPLFSLLNYFFIYIFNVPTRFNNFIVVVTTYRNN